MRTTSYTMLVAVALVMAPTVIAWAPSGDTLVLQPESKLWVAGTSTVRGFQCTAKTLTVEVSSAPRAVALLASGEKAVTAVSVRVAAGELDCANGTMNGHMLKALKASEYPEIAFDLVSYDLASTPEGIDVTVHGHLTLGGQTKPISMNAKGATTEDGALRVVGVYDLKLSDYGLKAPKLMLGAMKVHDLVKVHFDLLLKE